MVKLPNKDPSQDEIDAGKQFQKANRATFNQDFDVWANKAPCFHPLQVKGDGPFGKLRIWYQQFYNTRKDAIKYQKRANGIHATKGTATAPW